jgi:hypothetical protein
VKALPPCSLFTEWSEVPMTSRAIQTSVDGCCTTHALPNGNVDSPVDRRRWATQAMYPAAHVRSGCADVLTTAATVEAAIKNEFALYEPMRRVIKTDWAKDHRREPLAVEITALRGRRATGGIWSRPDIVSVEVRTFAYVPGKYLEVATFEVKVANAINVQACYEALAHRRAATHSYVLLHVPADQSDNLEDDVADVAEAARAHGIGVIAAADPADYRTWEEREEARRVEPDPERLNTFVATQLSDTARDLISRRLR